jgi:N-acetylglucosamine-6-phosphate deacetylase
MQTAGLFDLQVNGYAGIDFNDAGLTADALDHALEAMLAAGVTQCLPTLITATEPDLAARLAALDAAIAGSRLGPAMVPGLHLEGPFLNPEPGFRGCHPAGAMVPPDIGMTERLMSGLRCPVRLITLAAELPGAEGFIAWATARGILVSIGHSDAGAAVVGRAAAAGARMSTHLGNGLPPTLPKLDNPIMAQLAEDRLHASFIADGIHVPVPALTAMIRAKGPGRAVLVTDAVAAAGAAPGRYRFAGMTILGGADGSARTEAGALAGSALTLDRAVRNVVAWGIADAAGAVAMAGGTPARLLGLPPLGVVTWSDDLRVTSASLAGRVRSAHRS